MEAIGKTNLKKQLNVRVISKQLPPTLKIKIKMDTK
jgi:hypothetical protein